MKKKVALFVGVLCIAVIFYYSFTIFEARKATPTIIAEAKAKISEPIFVESLTESRLELLLKVQDPNFLKHNGTDFISGKITTITQSLVKSLYFENFKPGLAKIRQSLIAAFALNPLTSKDDQLFLFLNLAYLGQMNGEEVRGFNEASQVYFGKSFSAISDDEYLGLLAMLNGPNEYSIKLRPEKNAERVSLLKRELKL